MSKWFFFGFLSGAAIGGLCGLLTAPIRGSAARERVRGAADPAFVKLSGIKVNLKAWVDSASEAIKQAI